MNQLIKTISLCALICSLAQPLFAQQHSTYPNKPIQVVVPVAAGGGTDLLARTLGQKVSEELGQPFILTTNWAQAEI